MSVDRILLEGMSFFGYHGALPEERRLGQRFVVDLEISADLAQAGRDDDLGATVDYGQVYEIARSVVEGEPAKLIEAVAERIASRVLKLSHVEAVRVRVKKPSAPIPGSALTWAAIEISRWNRHRLH